MIPKPTLQTRLGNEVFLQEVVSHCKQAVASLTSAGFVCPAVVPPAPRLSRMGWSGQQDPPSPTRVWQHQSRAGSALPARCIRPGPAATCAQATEKVTLPFRSMSGDHSSPAERRPQRRAAEPLLT